MKFKTPDIKPYHLAIPAGITASQILATLQVYFSNRVLYEKTAAMIEAGYLTVPNAVVLPTLKQFFPAFFGGLFFTLTIGIVLTVLSFLCALLWLRFFSRNKKALPVFVFAALIPVLFINANGFVFFPSGYFIIVCPLVFILSATRKNRLESLRATPLLGHAAVFSACGILLFFTVQTKQHFFSHFRHHILMVNPAGKAINDFYYKYTLYAAEVFKSTRQKLLTSVDLQVNQTNGRITANLRQALIQRDYLPLVKDVPYDVTIRITKDNFIFSHKNEAVLTASHNDFFRSPSRYLKQYSNHTDRHAVFRQLTFVSLIFSFSLLAYLLVYLPFRLITRILTKSDTAIVIALLLTFLAAIFSHIYVSSWHIERMGFAEIKKNLNSGDWKKRVKALQSSYTYFVNIDALAFHEQSLNSPHTVERYWLAKALMSGKSDKTRKELLELTQDPDFNVRYVAYHNLGYLREKQVAGKILQQLKTSECWYCQWYAYKTLKKIGWTQNRLN